MNEGASRTDFLDGLRGIAVLLVVFSHFSSVGLHLLWWDFAGIGKAGVYLFFVLSAYLLTCQILRVSSNDRYSFRYWAIYLLKRFFRIYPLYGFVLLVSCLITYLGYPYVVQLSLQDVVDHLLLLRGISIFWTIPVEFVFYLVLPFVAMLLVILRSKGSVLLLCACLLLLLLPPLFWPPESYPINGIFLAPYLPIFISGSVLALLTVTIDSGSIRFRLRESAWVLSVICLLCAVLLTVPSVWRVVFVDDIPNHHFHRSYTFYALVWASLILVLYLSNGPLRACFAFAPLRFFGRISFSIYLVHLPILMTVSALEVLPVFIRAWLALILTLVVSLATYESVERPFIKAGQLLAGSIGRVRPMTVSGRP